MLLARVEEQLGSVTRFDEGMRDLEIIDGERVGVLPVHLQRDTLGPCRRRTPRVGGRGDRTRRRERRQGLGELLRGHDAEGEAGVDSVGADPSAAATPRSPIAPNPLRTNAMPSSIVVECAAFEQVGYVHGVPCVPQLVGEGCTPAVSPWTWWYSKDLGHLGSLRRYD